MYTVYRLDNTSASSPVDHKKNKKSAIEDADATKPPIKMHQRFGWLRFFFSFPYFVAGFMLGGKVCHSVYSKNGPGGRTGSFVFSGGMAWHGMGWAGMVKWCEAKIHEIDGVL